MIIITKSRVCPVSMNRDEGETCIKVHQVQVRRLDCELAS